MTAPLPSNFFQNTPVALRGHSGSVWSLAFSPSNQLLASASEDRTVRLWNATSGIHIASLSGHSGGIYSVAFSPDGAMLATGSADKTIKLWNAESRMQMKTLQGHSDWVYSVAFSPDGTILASGSRDNTIRLWNMKSMTSINTLEGHSDYVIAVVFSPDGKRIASGSEDRTIRVWDVASGTTDKTLKGHSSGVASIAFSPSSKHLASASSDTTIRFWDVNTSAHVGTIKTISFGVNSIAFSPDGQHLASGTNGNSVGVWDVASRTRISFLYGQSSSVFAVAYSPDGTRIASGSFDDTIQMWKKPEELKEPEIVTIASDVTVTPDQQDTLTPGGLAPVPDVNTTESSSLQDNMTNIYQDTVTSDPTPVPLNNDITGSVSLEGATPIGYGGFGDLFLGIHQDHGKVALKKPRRFLNEALVRRFLREINLWCSVSHPHILPCLGMCKIGLDVYVVSPFIENGDLFSCMVRGQVLNRSKLLFEVVEALTHLHHRGIVHGDVKAQNILLSHDGSALLCDFGLAKAFDTMATSTDAKGSGSVRWMAPELFLDESRSTASDVYSLGITIAEVLSGHAPYPKISESFAVMLHVAYHDGRPAKEPLSSPEGQSYGALWETAEKCWVKDPKARPHMAQVLGMLYSPTREMT